MSAAGEHTHDPSQLALLAGVASRLGELTDVASDLREATAASKIGRLIAVIGVGLVAVQLVLVGALVWLATLNLSNGSDIRSCTTPGGSCYERGAQQTAAAVERIVERVDEHVDIVLTCTRRPLTNEQFVRCLTAARAASS